MLHMQPLGGGQATYAGSSHLSCHLLAYARVGAQPLPAHPCFRVYQRARGRRRQRYICMQHLGEPVGGPLGRGLGSLGWLGSGVAGMARLGCMS